MATYVNDLRLKEISTGDESGTWGTSTNTSLELIGEALGYATQQVFGSDADATTTIADGASDPARAMYFKITSAGSLTATRTCTIAPNTVSRVMFIENATTGSQSIAISQGSGANVTILTGKTAIVYLDGAGSGAAVVDAMAGVDPGVTDTLAEVLTAGNTTTTDQKIQFRDTGIYINSSADGQLDIVADTEIQIAATTVDLNGNLDVSGTIAVGGVVTANAGVVVDNITIDGNDISTTNSNGNLTITPNGTGNVNINSDTLAVSGVEGESASLILAADESDDNADIWKVTSNIGNTLTIGNQISGSVVEHITITPNATVANSLASFAGKLTTAGVITAPSLDISGDIDVDGTTNLDVVDIDGAVDMASTLAVAGDANFDSGTLFVDVSVNSVGIGNGTTQPTAPLDVRRADVSGIIAEFHQSAGYGLEFGSSQAQAYIEAGLSQTLLMTVPSDMTIDAGGDIVLDSDSGYVLFKDAGTEHARIYQNNSGDVNISSQISNKDMKFNGNDNGTGITALTLDMSDGGTASFNSHIRLGDNKTASFGAGFDLEITSDGTNGTIGAPNGNLTLDVAGDITLDADGGDIRLKDGGTQIGQLHFGSSNLSIYSNVQDKDIIFLGNDNGSEITALTLDMSAAGAATFNTSVLLSGVGGLTTTGGNNLTISGTVADHAGLIMATHAILPAEAGAEAAANVIDIGANGNEFKNLYLDTGIITSNALSIATGTDLTLDAGGDIILDADGGGDILFKDGTVDFFKIRKSGATTYLEQPVENGYIYIKGNDGNGSSGVNITALSLNMGAAGAATFNSTLSTGNMTISGQEIDVSQNDLTLDVAGNIFLNADGSLVVFADGAVEYGRVGNSSSDFAIQALVQDKDIVFKGNDNGTIITALTLDMSAGGAATFSGGITVPSAAINGQLNVTGTTNSNNIYAEQLATQFDTSSFMRFHPTSTTNSGGFTNIFFGTSTSNNYGVAIGGKRAGTNDEPSFEIRMLNDSTVGTQVLNITNAGAATFSSTIAAGAATFTTAANLPQLQLISTDADNNPGPVLDLWRNSASPADGDDIGRIYFYGENDASQKIEYVMMRSSISDVTDGTEDSQFQIYTYVAGAQADRLHMNPNETIFNESSKDVDFRIESDGNANMLFVDGGNNAVGIGTNAPASYYSTSLVVSAPDEDGITILSPADAAGYLMFADGTSGNAAYRGYLMYDHGPEIFVMNSAANVQINATNTYSVVINEGGYDVDFRVESDTEANAFTVDGETGQVGVGSRRGFRFGSSSLQGNAGSSGGGYPSIGYNIRFQGTAGEFGTLVTDTSWRMDIGDNDRLQVYSRSSSDPVTGTASYTAGPYVSLNGTAWTDSSDARLKENVNTITGAIDKVKAMRPVNYTWIHDGEGASNQVGFIAQEMALIVPEVVDIPEDDEVHQGIQYGKLVPVLTAALQEALTNIESLESRITALES